MKRSMITTVATVRAAALAVVGLSTQAVLAAPATTDTAAELQALKDRIAQLEASQQRVDGAELQAKAIDAAITDADSKRAFLQADTFTSGWENGFKLQSADGAYVLQPYIESQFRYVANDTADASDGLAGDGNDGDDDFQAGFEVRRLKVGLKGNAFSKDFKYNVRVNFDRSTGEAEIDYAFGEYQFAKEWAVRAGQFKLNWTHEETVSDTRQLAAERSLLNQLFGGGNTTYVQGVSLLYGSKTNPFHGEVAFTDGDGSYNTNYTDQQNSDSNDYQNFGVAARGEYKVFGDWENYGDFTARKTKDDLLVVGGGADWAQGGDGDVYRFTIDTQYENAAGLSAYVAGIYTLVEGDAPDPILDNSWGALAQVGYLIPGLTEWEAFGRYSYLHIDEDNGLAHDGFHEITAGVNKYFVGHNAKFTLDVGYLPNGSFTGASGLGVTNNDEDQIVFRTQFQIVL